LAEVVKEVEMNRERLDVLLSALHGYRRTTDILRSIFGGEFGLNVLYNYAAYITASMQLHLTTPFGQEKDSHKGFDEAVYYRGLDELLKLIDVSVGFGARVVKNMATPGDAPPPLLIDIGSGPLTLPSILSKPLSEMWKTSHHWACYDKRNIPAIVPGLVIANREKALKHSESIRFEQISIPERLQAELARKRREHKMGMGVFFCQVLHGMTVAEVETIMDCIGSVLPEYIYVIDYRPGSPLSDGFATHVELQTGHKCWRPMHLQAIEKSLNKHAHYHRLMVPVGAYHYMATFSR